MRIESSVTSRWMAVLLMLGFLGGGSVVQAQNTGPADRGAAGNGSMGIGQGIDPQPQRAPSGQEGRDDGDHSADDPGHGGGNETDMQHHNQYQAQPEKRD